MKKIIISLALIIIGGFTLNAQNIVTNEPKALNPNAPVIYFEEMEFDYGTIVQGADGTHNFIFKNVGKEPLILSNVRSSCGCTIPEWPKEPIFSGKQDTIIVSYNTQLIGPFNKSINIFSNATKQIEILRIKGNVVEKK